jgi:hypothetical protein
LVLTILSLVSTVLLNVFHALVGDIAQVLDKLATLETATQGTIAISLPSLDRQQLLALQLRILLQEGAQSVVIAMKDLLLLLSALQVHGVMKLDYKTTRSASHASQEKYAQSMGSAPYLKCSLAPLGTTALLEDQ